MTDDKYKPRDVCDTFDHKWIEMTGNGPVRLFECAQCGVTMTVIPENRKKQRNE